MSMAVREVVVTGLGLVTPWGAGGRDLAARLRAGMAAGPIPGRAAAEDLVMADFDARAILGPRGLRHLTAGTRYLLGAARLALEDAGFSSEGEAPAGGGVAVGTVTGTAALVAEFDRFTLREGPQAVNPGVFPQTVWNSPSSQVAIRFGLGGPNLTVATGHTSGLDAVRAAGDLCRDGRSPLFLAGGFEELTPLFRALFPEPPGRAYPLAEGAAVLVLEDGEAALARGASPLAGLHRGWSEFDPEREDESRTAPPAGVWAVDLSDGGEHTAPAGGKIALVSKAGAGGGFTGALAAALAAAPGGPGGTETVLGDDGAGQRSCLPVERR